MTKAYKTSNRDLAVIQAAAFNVELYHPIQLLVDLLRDYESPDTSFASSLLENAMLTLRFHANVAGVLGFWAAAMILNSYVRRRSSTNEEKPDVVQKHLAVYIEVVDEIIAVWKDMQAIGEQGLVKTPMDVKELVLFTLSPVVSSLLADPIMARVCSKNIDPDMFKKLSQLDSNVANGKPSFADVLNALKLLVK